MHPIDTYHLQILFLPEDRTQREGLKEDVQNWLLGSGEEAFVEGVIDDLYLDLPYGDSAEEQYQALGGSCLPISVYKYDKQHLIQLKEGLEKDFLGQIRCEVSTLLTETWMEGWKESFKPIRTTHLYIYPPWIEDGIPQDLIPVCIEPGMAFGTGQHATTMLCVRALEKLLLPNSKIDRLLDVGTGTAILAIAAAKLGVSEVCGTDIDPDAILAARENSQVNQVHITLQQGTFPQDSAQPYSLVVANIIFYVLRQIIGELAEHTASGGYLVLSGILAEERRDMETLALPHGLSLVSEATESDWACQVYKKG